MNRSALLAALFCIGTVWGLTIALTKIAVSTGHQALGLVLWELIFSVVLLGGYLAVTGQGFAITPKRLLLFGVVSIAGTILPGAFSYRAAAELPAGVMSITIALVPLFALPIALMLGLERPQFRRLLGVVLGAIAVILIIGPRNALPDPSKVGYVLIALVAPVCYGFEGNFVSWRGTQGLSPIQTLFGASVLGVVLALPLVSVTSEWVNLWTVWGAAEWALIGVIFLHVGAYAGYIWLVGQAGSVFASQVAYLVTITGVLWSILLLKEGYSPWIWASLITLLVGVSLVLPSPRKAKLGPDN